MEGGSRGSIVARSHHAHEVNFFRFAAMFAIVFAGKRTEKVRAAVKQRGSRTLCQENRDVSSNYAFASLRRTTPANPINPVPISIRLLGSGTVL